MNHTNLVTIQSNQIFLFFANTIGLDNTYPSSRSITPEEMEEKRKSLSSRISRENASPVVYGIKEVENLLGISHPLLYKLIRNKELRSFKVGRRRMITGDAIEDFIAKRESEGERNVI